MKEGHENIIHSLSTDNILLKRCKLGYINQKSRTFLFSKVKLKVKSFNEQSNCNFFFRCMLILRSLKWILLRMTKNEFGQPSNFEIC